MTSHHLLTLLAFVVAATLPRPGWAAAPADPALRSELERIGAMRTYFGHQSVGYNIVDGIADLSAQAGVAVPIAEVSDSLAGAPAAFLHGRVGENGAPVRKLEAFARVLGAAPSSGVDVALVKFCYVDFGAGSDPRAIFGRYQATIAALRAQHPATTFVHVTVPLTTIQGGLKGWVKRLLGREPYGVSDNLVRESYNALLRGAYAGREPLVDIARVETTTADGSPWTVEWNGKQVPAMVPAYTEDGGHLNREGRRRVARELISVLANLPRKSPRAAGNR